ncbi:cell wall-active antibiotics response protein [Mucilaginibacter sp. RS28]|uniref:Cell wall-active antibiotics response protein n=1 Tax=Mucilaginibacter straminoryzae TaxID=2932774 RepID=A0A9X2BB52_9SPHI|nr:DUF5668 domain-containing protein [Mucilaginibacter straminoryzae]MCJ8209462.1 cell wall-active antibiotics response protein [Mucilaginibacter straminoryzae]
MKKDRLGPGIILVLIGVAILLVNLGYLEFHWSNFLHLWPVFLIIGGVNLLLANNRTVAARIVKTGVLAAGLFVLFFADFGDRFSFLPHIYFNHRGNGDEDFSFDDDDSDTVKNGNVVKIDGNNFYHTPYTAVTKFAKLNISGGGMQYRLSDTTNELFSADIKEYYGHHVMKVETHDSSSVIDFRMKGDARGHFRWSSDDKKTNKAEIKLNLAPIWNINVNAGATDLDFDLSKYKVSNFAINGGAASFKVKLGQPVEGNTEVTVKSGVSDITVNVPKDAACSINSSTGLSDNNFSGFTKTESGRYETPGFSAASKKIIIRISGGLSDFKVNRY